MASFSHLLRLAALCGRVRLGAIVLVTLMAIDGRATAGDVLLVIDLSAQIQIQLDGAVTLIGEFIQTLRAADHYLWLRDLADRVARPPRSPLPRRRCRFASRAASGSRASPSATRAPTSTCFGTSTSRSRQERRWRSSE